MEHVVSQVPAPDAEPSVDDASPAGVLVSVNVGLPRDVAWRGRTVHTGVWKSPVAGPRMVRALNVDGDGQGDLAGHGGPNRAVLVYQLDSYDYWRAHLGRDDFEFGQFGENFTVTGLSDEDVCIGDRLAIGEALFEVSQPRVTCYRVGLRVAEPRLPALLVSHRRPGFYLRVLREGHVSAGDPIVRVLPGPERLSVADADALLYLPGHDRADVERALRIPALSPGWRESFQAMLERTGWRQRQHRADRRSGWPPCRVGGISRSARGRRHAGNPWRALGGAGRVGRKTFASSRTRAVRRRASRPR